MERSLLVGLAAFRWAGWLWMATVLLLARRSLARPGLAVGLVAAALAVTVATTLLLRRRPARLLDLDVVAVELAVGVALIGADGWAYGSGHTFSAEQSLGVAWPLAGVLSAGLALGPWAGLAGGGAMGAARALSTLTHLPAGQSGVSPEEALSLVSTAVMYGLAGAIAGYLANLLRRAERTISAARAREEVARTLHDGVLQTLAVVERRVDDPALSRLARDQERELREFLFGVGAEQLVGRGDLGDALRHAAGRFERTFGGRVQVLVPDDLPTLDPGRLEALAGAVGEALTNAGKHGHAAHVTVFVEPDDGGVFCSVKDDGGGFDPAATPEGVGLRRSVRARIVEVGGHVDVAAAPDRGCEVRLWVPSG